MAIQSQPEQNTVTTPTSYWARVIPKDSLGYAQLAERIVQKNPVCSVEQAESVLRTRDEAIKELMIEGYQVSLENAFTYHPTITARLDAPDDPLPPDATVNVQIYAARPFVEAVRHAAKLERLPPEQKMPLIAGAEDTVLGLKDVLNPGGVLRLTGPHQQLSPPAAHAAGNQFDCWQRHPERSGNQRPAGPCDWRPAQRDSRHAGAD